MRSSSRNHARGTGRSRSPSRSGCSPQPSHAPCERRRCSPAGPASPAARRARSIPRGCNASRRWFRTGSAGRRGAAAHGGRRPACWQASRPAGPREGPRAAARRSEEHTSELQSRSDLVCRLLLEKKKKKKNQFFIIKKKKKKNKKKEQNK